MASSCLRKIARSELPLWHINEQHFVNVPVPNVRLLVLFQFSSIFMSLYIANHALVEHLNELSAILESYQQDTDCETFQ